MNQHQQQQPSSLSQSNSRFIAHSTGGQINITMNANNNSNNNNNNGTSSARVNSNSSGGTSSSGGSRKKQPQPSQFYGTKDTTPMTSSGAGKGSSSHEGKGMMITSPKPTYKSLVSKPNVQIKGTPQILAPKRGQTEPQVPSNGISTSATTTTPGGIQLLQKPTSGTAPKGTANTSQTSSQTHLGDIISQNYTSANVTQAVNIATRAVSSKELNGGQLEANKPSTSSVAALKLPDHPIIQGFTDKGLSLIHEIASGSFNSILELQSNHLQQLANLFPNDKQLSTESNNYSVIGVIEVFAVEDVECFLDCKYKTSGVDIYRTSDQQIFIDTQPLFASQVQHPTSGSGYYSTSGHSMGLTSSGSKSFEPSVEAVSIAALESFVDITSLQIALFVFSVAHVVIVMLDHQSDALEQFKMFQFIQTIRMLQQGVPSITQCGKVSSSAAATLEGHVPEIVFVFNKVQPRDMSELNIKHMQALLDSYFSSTYFRKNGHIHPHMWHHNFKKNETVNFFMIPFTSKKIEDIAESFNILKKGIHTMPKPVFKKMSQAEWFSSTVRNFEVIKKSYFLQEYIRKITSSMSVHN
ncbi:hypothetical protein C9374_011210 [Naegleria lovaniensis]|uniref:Uncharacterized protein n=1 Tax=Naegleria lovaniensis TaxID=51637 RepID=A0AA88GHC1_NAELO|nr:uncharacterized protein C9374_011210 [Naegleria lovaniensis]KAG2374131.1 hypothetical protein C9374_011210 [Naegleria lovaniensis]